VLFPGFRIKNRELNIGQIFPYHAHYSILIPRAALAAG